MAEILALGDITLDRETGVATRRGIPIELAAHEFRVLERLFARPGQVVPRGELLAASWDPRQPPQPASLDAMVSAVRQKMRGAGVDLLEVRGVGFQATERTPGFQEDAGFRTLFYGAGAGVVLVDADGMVVRCNPALHALLGYDTQELHGASFESLLQPDQPQVVQAPRRALQDAEAGATQLEARLRRKDGSSAWGLVSFSVTRDDAGKPRFALGMVQDITERKRAEEALERLSVTDELTGLYNRRGFLMLADRQWRLARRKGERLVLLYLDLDDFKTVNDTLGHDVGDRLLVDAAQLLQAVCRDSDTVARLGGDEFVVLASDADPAGAEALQERLRTRMDAYNRRAADDAPRLAASIGVVSIAAGDEGSLDELLRRADQLMYEQKRARRAVGTENP